MNATSRIRRVLPFVSIAFFGVLIYDGSVFYNRWSRNRKQEQARAEKEAEQARHTLELLGGGGLKILNFYASPRAVQHGSETTLCYSVMGAKTVRLEPPVKELHPALSYCFQTRPKSTTEYRLLADDEAGHSAQETLTVQVRR